MNLGDPLDRSRPSWKLYSRLLTLGVSVDETAELMNGHAHELAERIRQDTTVMGEAGDQYALLYADLIDPEVKPRTRPEPSSRPPSGSALRIAGGIYEQITPEQWETEPPERL
ncbi:hypothetical protein [Streptomyces sp. B21-083]|uniref:hypothetical protein n=1 Tax=Streptomyces sp. B21-083 TaxID=3039410 RepID=UPI002FEF0A38